MYLPCTVPLRVCVRQFHRARSLLDDDSAHDVASMKDVVTTPRINSFELPPVDGNAPAAHSHSSTTSRPYVPNAQHPLHLHIPANSSTTIPLDADRMDIVPMLRTTAPLAPRILIQLQLVHVTPDSHLLPRASPSLNQTRSLPLLRSKSTYFPMFIVPTPLVC